jgi:hypothetical protein
MVDIDLSKLAELQAAYIEQIKAAGRLTVTFNAPCCGKSIETEAPKRNESWSSLSVCHHCGGMFLKIVQSKRAIGLLPEAIGGAG